MAELGEMGAVTTAFQAQLDVAMKHVGDAALAGAVATARAILDRALYYCPVQTGRLRGTGRLGDPEVSGGGALGYATVSVPITFGGPDAPYAVQVHENTDMPHRPPTRSKFLEAATMEEASGALKAMGEAALRNGG